jgi:hypothetical protein
MPKLAASATSLRMSNPFRDKFGDDEIIEAELVEPGLLAHYANRQPPAEAAAVFHVPTRFGMSAILGITTALAILFGILRSTGAPVIFYWFFSLLSLIICLVQMRFGEVPRQGSMIAGAVLMPLFVIIAALLDDFPIGEGHVMAAVFCIFAGAFLGYLTGTCLGGVFLLMDLFEKFWTRSANHHPVKTTLP